MYGGGFPTLIAIITMFFAGSFLPQYQGLISALFLLAVILLGISMTFVVSAVLSKTLLKGLPSTFILELPPYRRPQFGKVILRSILDRVVFVLLRAISVATVAGAVIWLLANVQYDSISLLKHCSNFLDPFAKLMGLDGVILLAFILGFPANEIVLPIIIMSYLSMGNLVDFATMGQLKELLVTNGWTWLTAVCTMLFMLMHFPCGTTCLTIKKETKSWKWTFVSFLIPTITGILICTIVATAIKLLGFV